MLPGLGRLGRFDVGRGEQIVVERGQHLAQRDTCQHEGVAADAAPKCQQDDDRRGGCAADDRTCAGDECAGGGQDQDRQQAACRRATCETDNVGAAQGVAGNALEDSARHAKHAADDDRSRRPWQPLFEHHERGQLLTLAAEYRQEHVEGHRVGAGGQGRHSPYQDDHERDPGYRQGTPVHEKVDAAADPAVTGRRTESRSWS